MDIIAQFRKSAPLAGFARALLEIKAYSIYLMRLRANRIGHSSVLLLEADTRESVEIAKAARASGYRLYIVSPLYRNPAARFAASLLHVDPFTQERCILDYARSHDIKAILLGTDESLLPLAARLSESLKLGIYSGTAALCSMDKTAMRKNLDSIPACSIAWQEITQDILNAGLVSTPLPAVLKPVDGTLSVGVTHIDRLSQLKGAYDALSRNHGRLILEQFVNGPQYCVEVLSRHGEHRIYLFMSENYMSRGGSFPALWYMVNPSLDEHLRNELSTTAVAALDACDIKNGVTMCQMRLSPDGRAHVIELGNRMGAKYLNWILQATGVSIFNDYLQTMVGDEIVINNKLQSSVLFRFVYKENELSLFDALAKDKRIRIIQQLKKRGTYSKGVDYLGSFIIAADVPEDLLVYLTDDSSGTESPERIEGKLALEAQ